MNVAELLQAIENTKRNAMKSEHGGTAIRITTIYRDVLLYLVSKGKLSMADDESEFYKYVYKYSPPDLYKVANHFRKTNGMELLNYPQPFYHKAEDR